MDIYSQELAYNKYFSTELKNLLNLLFPDKGNDEYLSDACRRGVELHFIQYGVGYKDSVDVLKNIIIRHTDLNGVVFNNNHRDLYRLILDEIDSYTAKRREQIIREKIRKGE